MGLSIITQFGCTKNCPYCIDKLSPVVSGVAPREKILDFLSRLPSGGRFSVSGGGEPLNEPEKHMEFWDALTEICSERQITCSIHTALENADEILSSKLTVFRPYVSKLVFHCNLQSNLAGIIKNHMNKYKIRVTYVVSSDLDSITEMCSNEFLAAQCGIEYSYRELYGYPELKPAQIIDEFARWVKNRIPNARYVCQDDYNVYLMPDGNIKRHFLPVQKDKNRLNQEAEK